MIDVIHVTHTLECIIYVWVHDVFARSTKYTFMNPGQYTFYFWNMLYGINHGFYITHDLLVMDWHFKDIL